MEVIDPETVTTNTNVPNTPALDLSQLTAEQLEAELKKRQSEKDKAKNTRIKKYHKDKQDFVETVVDTFAEFQGTLKEFKDEIIKKANYLHEERYAMHEKDVPEHKQFTIFNEDKTKKIVTDFQERFDFTEEADVAIDSIRAFFKNKFEKHSKLVYSLLDELLIKNKKGDYDPRLLTKLRSKVNEINDPKLTEAYNLLENSKIVVGSSLYCRAYKQDANNKFQEISIQFSSL